MSSLLCGRKNSKIKRCLFFVGIVVTGLTLFVLKNDMLRSQACRNNAQPINISHQYFGFSSFRLQDDPETYKKQLQQGAPVQFVKRYRFADNQCKELGLEQAFLESGRLFTERELNISSYCQEKPLIPKIIHQQWKSYDIPAASKEMVESVVQHHKEWEYWFWTDKDINCYVKTRHPELWPVFIAYESNIQRADVFRYIQMLDFGGFYLDLDIKCFRPLDVWRFMASNVMVHFTYENLFIWPAFQHANVYQGVLASRPKHPFYSRILNPETLKLYQQTCMKFPVHSTGPKYQDNIYQEYMQKHFGKLDPKDDILVIHPR